MYMDNATTGDDTLQGPVLQVSSGQAVIRWYVAATLADRAKLARVGRRTRGYRVNHRAARTRWERAGELAMTREPSAEVNRPYVVRLYYRSMGGEILYCETIHSAVDAYKLRSEYRATSSDAVDVQTWPAGEKPFWILHGARFVLLPSQMPAPMLACESEPSDTVRMLAAV